MDLHTSPTSRLRIEIWLSEIVPLSNLTTTTSPPITSNATSKSKYTTSSSSTTSPSHSHSRSPTTPPVHPPTYTLSHLDQHHTQHLYTDPDLYAPPTLRPSPGTLSRSHKAHQNPLATPFSFHPTPSAASATARFFRRFRFLRLHRGDDRSGDARQIDEAATAAAANDGRFAQTQMYHVVQVRPRKTARAATAEVYVDLNLEMDADDEVRRPWSRQRKGEGRWAWDKDKDMDIGMDMDMNIEASHDGDECNEYGDESGLRRGTRFVEDEHGDGMGRFVGEENEEVVELEADGDGDGDGSLVKMGESEYWGEGVVDSASDGDGDGDDDAPSADGRGLFARKARLERAARLLSATTA